MSEKYYQLGTHTAEQFHEIHELLCQTTSGVENIPNRSCTCYDEKTHSPTRGTFMLTDEEATALKNDARIAWLNIDYTLYPDDYRPPPEELQSTSVPTLTRLQGTVKVYREHETSNTLPGTPDATDVNRAPWSLTRHAQKLDPWVDQGQADNYVFESTLTQYGDGADVDVIVADDGAGWIGHPEFQNNCIDSPDPDGYTGGNVLPGNGTCDVLDIVLDAPYYLDPDFFDADPGSRLETRWDGTTVPVESVARAWWTGTNNRSSVFNAKYPSAGVIPFITSSYTRSNCNGSNTAQSSVGQHCTPCMALTYGRTQGWAYNANKWALNLYGTYGADIEYGFDIQKIFHNTKPVNSKYGTQDPTVSSNSWGYRATKAGGTNYYHFRGGAAVSYTSEPAFISHMGITGDSGRWKSEMKDNSLTTALDELIDSGVLFVCAAGNSNQKQTNYGHQDFDNYISTSPTDTLEDSSYSEFGVEVTGTTNRRGFPQQGGKTVDPVTGEITYKTINIGALDDEYATGNIERKVTYSDRGEGIDAYFAADGILAANRSYTSEGIYPVVYPGFTANSGSGSGVPEDCAFGGTSAACPVGAGFIATLVGLNRSWTHTDVKNYFNNLDDQDASVFYYGSESTSATDSNWNDYNSLEGGPAKVAYQDPAAITQTSFPKRAANIGTGLNLSGLSINRVNRFDRGR